jgi:hypothetical protein
MRRLWKRLVKAWRDPIRVQVRETRSPDWDGDAKRHRQAAGWEK